MCNRNYLGRALKERVVTESQKACCSTFYSYHWLWVFMFPPVSRCRHFLICSVSFFVSMRVLFIVIRLVQHQWLFLCFWNHMQMAWQELWNRWYPCWRENLKSAGYCAWQKCCRTDICQLTVTYHVCPHRFHSCMFESEWTSFLGLFHVYSLLMCFLCFLFVALQTFFKNIGEQVSCVHNFMMICPMCRVFGSARWVTGLYEWLNVSPGACWLQSMWHGCGIVARKQPAADAFQLQKGLISP